MLFIFQIKLKIKKKQKIKKPTAIWYAEKLVQNL